MNPIALINDGGGLDGKITFPLIDPQNQYLNGTGGWSTISSGSGSRVRNVINIESQTDVLGPQTTLYGSVHGNILQHTDGTDSVVLITPGSTINLNFPATANNGDRIVLIVSKTTNYLHLYPCTSTSTANRTIYDTSLDSNSQKNPNSSGTGAYYLIGGDIIKDNFEFYYIASKGMWCGPIATFLN